MSHIPEVNVILTETFVSTLSNPVCKHPSSMFMLHMFIISLAFHSKTCYCSLFKRKVRIFSSSVLSEGSAARVRPQESKKELLLSPGTPSKATQRLPDTSSLSSPLLILLDQLMFENIRARMMCSSFSAWFLSVKQK